MVFVVVCEEDVTDTFICFTNTFHWRDWEVNCQFNTFLGHNNTVKCSWRILTQPDSHKTVATIFSLPENHRYRLLHSFKRLKSSRTRTARHLFTLQSLMCCCYSCLWHTIRESIQLCAPTLAEGLIASPWEVNYLLLLLPLSLRLFPLVFMWCEWVLFVHRPTTIGWLINSSVK